MSWLSATSPTFKTIIRFYNALFQSQFSISSFTQKPNHDLNLSTQYFFNTPPPYSYSTWPSNRMCFEEKLPVTACLHCCHASSKVVRTQAGNQNEQMLLFAHEAAIDELLWKYRTYAIALIQALNYTLIILLPLTKAQKERITLRIAHLCNYSRSGWHWIWLVIFLSF